uniref:3-phosphoshikimate 1-carboxyvinyltransferase n=1 Tax=Magnetococcus massalia (strain MO-1) TaxID=451514 RepID=A0A1S7LKH8_MAGMO|nr:3-phosphoshikimate 1-carboxyvinyltransferase (5-enolpyruvylshikimate-3-phosphate synthase) (EPSP synthase) (EPSPS) [Candidatus Magnetococcus massalia]
MSNHTSGPGRRIRSTATTTLSGQMRPAADKSISHRSIILGSIAEGETRVEGLLEGEDVLRTVDAFRAMGVSINRLKAGHYTIEGQGLDGLQEPQDVLDMGNSGTAMRLLAGLLASQPFHSVLTGDESLRGRPMGRVTTPLAKMGAQIRGRDGGKLAPLAIQGSELVPIEYHSPVASAQVKSAVMLAALNTAGETVVVEPAATRDHTERMLTAFGAEIERDGNRIMVEGWPDLEGQNIEVPADISAAAFPIVAALITPDSDITLENVGMNPTRTGILDLLDAMGADIERLNPREAGGEPVCDLRVKHSQLKGIETDPEVVPRAIDEFPVFFVAAALAEGETIVNGAEELRVKESDRLHAMALGLQALGATFEERPDGARIVGKPDGLAGGVDVDSLTDHRIAMSLLVAGLRCSEPVTVRRCDNINTSFPNFSDKMNKLGMRLEDLPNG